MDRFFSFTKKGLPFRLLLKLRASLGHSQNKYLFDPTERTTCLGLANDLEISEHEVFVRAYRWYYGHSPITVRKEFKRYLLSGCEEIPHYVRQFTRHWTCGELHA